MIGETIAKYKITRFIGEGGMAKVYEGQHELLGSKVAIKILNPTLSGNDQIKERFINEAKMMASLNHINITRVVDFDEQPDRLSILMEYLEGEDLSALIKRNGPMNEKELSSIFQQTLSAFDYAHSKGIVHRDIKPSNIFVLPGGEVKILDFGIAKLLGQGMEMTQTGTQMGTPMYMSPEQVKADKTIDHRSDIYSLGVTLYFALIGKTPYDTSTLSQFDVFNKIVYEPLPDLTGHGKLGEVIVKATQKDREQRFKSCKEWLKTLKSDPNKAVAKPDHTIIEPAANTQVEHTIIESAPVQAKSLKNTPNLSKKKPKSKKGIIVAIVVIVVLLISGYVALVVINNTERAEQEAAAAGDSTYTEEDAAPEATAPEDAAAAPEEAAAAPEADAPEALPEEHEYPEEPYEEPEAYQSTIDEFDDYE